MAFGTYLARGVGVREKSDVGLPLAHQSVPRSFMDFYYGTDHRDQFVRVHVPPLSSRGSELLPVVRGHHGRGRGRGRRKPAGAANGPSATPRDGGVSRALRLYGRMQAPPHPSPSHRPPTCPPRPPRVMMPRHPHPPPRLPSRS